MADEDLGIVNLDLGVKKGEDLLERDADASGVIGGDSVDVRGTGRDGKTGWVDNFRLGGDLPATVVRDEPRDADEPILRGYAGGFRVKEEVHFG